MGDAPTEGTDDWMAERDAFVAEDDAQRRAGHADYPSGAHVPDAGPSLGRLGSTFAELAGVLFAAEPGTGVAGVLSRLVDACVEAVPAADVVSVTLRREADSDADDPGYTTPAQSDPLAAKLDQLQYDHGEGPCVTALESGGLGVASSDDLAGDQRWTRFGPAAASLGMGSLHAVGLFPVATGRPLRGALNFYRHRPGGFAQGDRDAALLLAAHASVALAYAASAEVADLREQQFRTALDSRDVIGQAKGILMERRDCTAAEAFDVLRRTSQDLNVKVNHLAATLASRRSEL